MYSLDIIAVGTLKEEYLKSACVEYKKRLTPYARLSIHEVKEESFSKVGEKERVLRCEEERTRKKIRKDSLVCVLDQKGKDMTSEEFALFLKCNGEGGTHLTFVIGGALGVSPQLKKDARNLISLSRLTFTHQLVRIVLLEQTYRAMTILHGKQYHY